MDKNESKFEPESSIPQMIKSVSSESYAYQSPSKMTSPDKRRFAQRLFAHDDKINAKVGLALRAAKNVENRTL